MHKAYLDYLKLKDRSMILDGQKLYQTLYRDLTPCNFIFESAETKEQGQPIQEIVPF